MAQKEKLSEPTIETKKTSSSSHKEEESTQETSQKGNQRASEGSEQNHEQKSSEEALQGTVKEEKLPAGGGGGEEKTQLPTGRRIMKCLKEGSCECVAYLRGISIHREGWIFIGLAALLTVLFGWLWTPLWIPGILITAWMLFFFRDPSRVTISDPTTLVSPADGRVCAIASLTPPTELELGSDPRLCISIFMDIFNAHVNRAPLAGEVVRIAYKPGRFFNASLDKASAENERNGLVIRAGERSVGVVQIAGLVARRICCFVQEGEEIEAGQRIGLIRFGSRLDVYLPSDMICQVALGQSMIAGETILARAKETLPQDTASLREKEGLRVD